MPTGNKGGRHFEAVYSECLSALKNRVPQIVHSSHEVYSLIEGDATERNSEEQEETILLDGKKTIYKNTGNTAKSKKDSGAKSHRDPWGLSTTTVKKTYSKMKCPPLEMFHWKRVVVDE